MNRLTLAIILAALGGAAHATDGVIEINHARALAGGVTPGDMPGYPVTISQPGSYRLTSNLTQPDINTDLVAIAADGVTLDFNGFSMTGSNTCTWVGATFGCTTSGTGAGVIGTGAGVRVGGNDARIHGGTIRGLGGDGVGSTTHGFWVDHMTIAECGGAGINNSAPVNPYAAVTTVEYVTVRNNSWNGVHIPSNFAALRFSALSGNSAGGAFISRGIVLGNVFSQNSAAQNGLSSGNAASSQNYFVDSNGGNNNNTVSVPANSNVCNLAAC